jgi:hypothetical protein
MEKEYLREREVSERYGWSIKTLQQWRWQRRGPVYSKIGVAIRYRVADLEAFMEAGRVEVGDGS